jgi:hypothetical protein
LLSLRLAKEVDLDIFADDHVRTEAKPLLRICLLVDWELFAPEIEMVRLITHLKADGPWRVQRIALLKARLKDRDHD